ncbi:hypothetical protein [Kosakonia pseudosacchari]|uniref:hypothetical protein n=1 Tax=Kosakonia pseudosacchari TaxID=1646340 RepID=UPI001882BAA9|nr:hypothetical protein [Kosakonia pseudosacchari]QOV65822.1 hypothetical protein IP581_09340 [Kosakonia pseudosacchari]
MNFKAIWEEYSRKIEAGNIFDVNALLSLFQSHHIFDAEIILGSIGNGKAIDCFKIKSSIGLAFFPVYTTNMKEFSSWDLRMTSIKKKWECIDWFIPPYISNGSISSVLSRTLRLCDVSKERALDEFEYALPSLYTIPDMCVFVEQVAIESDVLSSHVNTLRESILSFYTGYQSSATASLIPIVESALEKLVINQRVTGKYLKDRIEGLINNAIDRVCLSKIYNGVWVDEQYTSQETICRLDDRALMFRVFGDWLKNSFFVNTNRYDKRSGLNRNIFSHGLSLVWQRTTNFHRLIGILNAVVFLEYYLIPVSKIGLFYPEMNEQSNSLWEDVNVRVSSQSFFKLKSAERTLRVGTKMPILTNDDGWFLRATILTDSCMKGLVEKLRDKAWCCTVHDPLKEGEFIKVDAMKNDRKLKIGLLYSCASSNHVYKKLEEECDVILYLGAPYNQNQYAYGIQKHVGPLQAWVIPD